MNGGTVQVDVEALRNLLATARRNGTVDRWCDLALEWAEKASARVYELEALYEARVTMDGILAEPEASELLRDLNDLMAKHGLKR